MRTARDSRRRQARALPFGGGCAIVVGGVLLAAGALFALSALVLFLLRGGAIAPAMTLLPGAILCVLAAGSGLVLNGWRHLVRTARARKRAALHPGEPWYSDWSWDPAGTYAERAWGVGAPLLALTFVVTCCAPCNYLLYVALTSDLSLPLKTGFIFLACVADVLILLVGRAALSSLVLRQRFGRPFMHFGSFPFFLGQTLRARIVAKALAGRERAGVTLRCVEEFLTVFEARQTVERAAGGGAELAVEFPLPEDGLPTRLGARRPRYWEIEVEAAATPESVVRFLVPVYSPVPGVARASRA